MTRITNFARKRTYVQAGSVTESNADVVIPTASKEEDPTRSPKKRRKGKKPSFVEDEPKQIAEGSRIHSEHGEGDSRAKNDDETAGHKTPKKRKPHSKHAVGPPSNSSKRSELRRLKRVAERHANTVCFMCREKGHAAKDCPKASGSAGSSDTAVGICYRCGSGRHTLSRCKKPEDPLNPLPFASCFVCSKKGHLASACPKNTEKGVYPNGGCCKLCGEKTHLAKDCALRKHDRSGTAAGTVFGMGKEAGADEDDFHVFKRKNAEVLKDERDESKQRTRVEVKVKSHTRTARLLGNPLLTQRRDKKVVYF
ncbi:hypothetical protein J3A83DRAFT_4231616 [Scleroderma citrinum]